MSISKLKISNYIILVNVTLRELGEWIDHYVSDCKFVNLKSIETTIKNIILHAKSLDGDENNCLVGLQLDKKCDIKNILKEKENNFIEIMIGSNSNYIRSNIIRVCSSFLHKIREEFERKIKEYEINFQYITFNVRSELSPIAKEFIPSNC